MKKLVLGSVILVLVVIIVSVAFADKWNFNADVKLSKEPELLQTWRPDENSNSNQQYLYRTADWQTGNWIYMVCGNDYRVPTTIYVVPMTSKRY
jgi:hypothetical protein